MSVLSLLIDYQWVILFYSTLFLLIYLNRKKFDRQGIAFILRTKLGLGLMDKVGTKARLLVKIFGYVAMVTAYLGFLVITYLLVNLALKVVTVPGTPGASLVLPGLEIAGLGTFPLIIGWISLLIIMVVHEFSHGIVARAYKIKIKSSGIAFIGPIPGAFVEPDEEEIHKRPHREQLSIFAAGPFSNILLWLVCLVLLIPIMQGIYEYGIPAGIQADPIQNSSLPAFSSGMKKGSVIVAIDDAAITNFSSFLDKLDSAKPGDTLKITTLGGSSFSVKAVENPSNASKAYIGVTNFEQYMVPKDAGSKILFDILQWLRELFFWTGLISVNIGLINLFPVFITDGAQMLHRNIEFLIKDPKRADAVWKYINWLGALILAVLFFMPMVWGALSALK